MQYNGLQLATQKIELDMLTSKRILTRAPVQAKMTAKYLDIMLDRKLIIENNKKSAPIKQILL